MIAIMLIAALLAGSPQEDQRPREPKKDDQGLLQVNRQFYDSRRRQAATHISGVRANLPCRS